MRIVLDTNVLLSAILPSSQHHWIIEKILDGEIVLCVSTDILSEYAELLERFYTVAVAEATLTAFLYSPAYFWRLIEQDHDDDKFVDCAIAAAAKSIISNDRHFNRLKSVKFPRVKVLTTDEFRRVMLPD